MNSQTFILQQDTATNIALYCLRQLFKVIFEDKLVVTTPLI